MLTALCAQEPALAKEARAAAVAALPSLVAVLPDWPANKRRNEEPEGSGVVVLDGHHIVTALHVLGEASSIRVATFEGEVVQANIVGKDPATDLALLRTDHALTPLEFAGDAEVGEVACAIGNAFGLGMSVSCGTVSAVHRAGTGFNPIEDFVQTDAAVNPGSSGGALIAADGRLIGILSAIFTKQSDANIGVNFAVASPLVARVVAALQDKGRVTYLSTGARVVPALERGDIGRRGALVDRLQEGGPAAQAGLKKGDIIVEAAGRRILAPADFQSVIGRLGAPEPVALRILRDGQEMDLNLWVDN